MYNFPSRGRYNKIMKNVKAIIGLTMPNGNDIKFIKKHGLRMWMFIWAVKIGGILFIVWFSIAVLGFHMGIGK